jgi:hypothetical protein
MSTEAREPATALAPQRSWMRRVHMLLAVQSLVVILVSFNRLTSLTLGYVAANEFLRWVDLNNMLVLPLISLVAFYLLKQELPYQSPALGQVAQRALGLLFVVGVYLLGAGYGDHEVTNYLHARVCTPDDGSALCRILIFNDDDFSHWVFFIGFILMNAALLGLQALFPRSEATSARDTALLALNGLFIGLGVFANLAFEEIGLDLYVVAALALLSVYLLARRGRQPLFTYYTVAYVFGLVATGIYKLLVG